MSIKSRSRPASLFDRITEILRPERPESEAAREALERIEQLQRRIEANREEIRRGVRPNEGRFRL